MKTMQQLYDAGLAHVRAQGVPSIETDEHGHVRCRYRKHLPDGKILKCIIGSMFPDELYQPYLDEGLGTPVGSLPAEVQAYIDAPMEDILFDMQAAHDEAAQQTKKPFLPVFEHKMAAIAATYGLTYKEPTP